MAGLVKTFVVGIKGCGAKAQEARAKVIEAEAEITKAIAESFRTGNLGIMDYYRMKNLQADTDMRDALGKGQGKKEDK